MALAEIEKRVAALETVVGKLARGKKLLATAGWWRESAGKFANDPVFGEIVRLGRRYRRSLRGKAKRAGQP